MLSTFQEYVEVTTFFQCVSLTKLNAWKDEWFIAIEVLQKGIKKQKKITKKGKNDIVCGQNINVWKLGAKWDW